jgi:8-oxo-dGTP diphosphatase
MSMNPSNSKSTTVVRVGVGVLVQDPTDPFRVVCGIRKGSHGAGTLALPGGHLELYESWQECAKREVLEECHLELMDDEFEFGHVTNDPMPNEGKHYVTIFMLAKCVPTTPPQQAQTMEPDKCEGWKSYSWKELQELQAESKLFGPLDRLVKESPPKVLEFLSGKSGEMMTRS